jgi:hypothetical protein
MGERSEMNLIAFTGLPRSGKDSAADWLCMHAYQRMRFADPLKAAAAILLGRTVAECNGDNGFDREAVMPEWGFSVRHFLQVFGTEAMRNNFGFDFWIKHMRRRIDAAGPDARIVITDCRFDNEAQLVSELGGIVVEIRRPGLVPSAHVSDAGVKPDIVLDNDGTLPEFAEKVGKLMLEYHAAITRQPAAEST